MSAVQYCVVYTGYGNDEPNPKRVVLHGYSLEAAEGNRDYVLSMQRAHGTTEDAHVEQRTVTYGPWTAVDQ